MIAISRVVRNGSLPPAYGAMAFWPTMWINESAAVLSLMEIISVAYVDKVIGVPAGHFCRTPDGMLFHCARSGTTSDQ